MVGVTAGSYQIVRQIGEGGMGAVYLGTYSILGRPAAIKLLLPELSQRRGGVRSGTDIIIDGKPCDSILIQKLGPAPKFGARMPNDGTILPEEDLTLLKDWIAEGALNN
jgi:serine/threonine protein kinase